MESYSKKTGKKFTGKFAETAVRLGLASENLEGKKQEKTPAKPSKVTKEKVSKPSKVKVPAKYVKDKTIKEKDIKIVKVKK
jgi:hypothetical protein